MSNQFVNPLPLEAYQKLLESPGHQEILLMAHNRFLSDPDACAITGTNPRRPSLFQITYEGARVWVSMRALYWLWERGTLPVFSSCSCGTKGCINPKHQVLLSEDRHNQNRLEPLRVIPRDAA